MTGFVYQSFPRAPLVGAGLLVGLVMISVAASRLTGAGASHIDAPKIEVSRDLRFADRADGSIAVIDASDNAEVTVLAPGGNGFIRGVLRSFARERRANEAAIDTASAGPPFRLAMSADHDFTLQDLATGRLIELNAFGDVNSGAFAQVLAAATAKETAR